MTLIQLTRPNGKPFLFNAEFILFTSVITKENGEPIAPKTRIFIALPTDPRDEMYDYVECKETPAEILLLAHEQFRRVRS